MEIAIYGTPKQSQVQVQVVSSKMKNKEKEAILQWVIYISRLQKRGA